jgi:hypothetical protein
MNVDIAQKAFTPATQPATSPLGKAAEAPHEDAAEFSKRLGGSVDPAANGTQAVTAQYGNAVDGATSTQRVNGAAVPDKQDLFGQFDHVRNEFNNFLERSSELDKLVADGKIKPDDPKVVQQRREEMRLMLHFQCEMQSASVKVEFATKVADHCTGAVKQVMSTQ